MPGRFRRHARRCWPTDKDGLHAGKSVGRPLGAMLKVATESNKQFCAVGSSMIPSIFPGSTLHVRKINPGSVKVGDILCYPESNQRMEAHRVVRAKKGLKGLVFITKGDAQDHTREIQASAAAYVVVRVENRFLSYNIEGLVGDTVTHLALREGLLWRGTRLVALATFELRRFASFIRAAVRDISLP